MSRSSPEVSAAPAARYPRATSINASAREYAGTSSSASVGVPAGTPSVSMSAWRSASASASSIAASARAACWAVRYRVTATSRAAITAAASSAGRYAVICTVPSVCIRVVTRRCSSAINRAVRPARKPRTARSSCAAVQSRALLTRISSSITPTRRVHSRTLENDSSPRANEAATTGIWRRPRATRTCSRAVPALIEHAYANHCAVESIQSWPAPPRASNTPTISTQAAVVVATFAAPAAICAPISHAAE